MKLKRNNFLFNLLCIILGVLPIITIVIYTIFGRNISPLCVSTVAAIPEGLYGYIEKYDAGEIVFNSIFNTNIGGYGNIGQSAQSVTEADDSISASVDKAIIGNIIKKTMSPYSANTKENSVYLSNTTGVSIDISKEMSKPLEFKVTKSNQPQILIYHTHATEGYMNNEEDYYTTSDEPRTTDCEKNVVKVGEVIKEQLEMSGYSVIHDKTLHDYPGYTGSYGRSAETIKKTLEKYPSIKIIIDVHRDSISSGDNDKVAPVVEIEGKEAAQVMLVMGSQTGTITDHPHWKQNLRLALKLQYLFETTYPQFARSLLLRSTKYNQNLSEGAFLIEVGSEANTLEQALYSAELVGKTLCCLLDSQ